MDRKIVLAATVVGLAAWGAQIAPAQLAVIANPAIDMPGFLHTTVEALCGGNAKRLLGL